MRPVLSCDEVRSLEDLIEKEGTSKAELMELAGEFAATQVERLEPKRVLVLVGFGNNGGRRLGCGRYPGAEGHCRRRCLAGGA